MVKKKKWNFGNILYEVSNGAVTFSALSIGSFYAFEVDLFQWLFETTFGFTSAWTEWFYIGGGAFAVYHAVVWINNLRNNYKWG